MDLPPNGATQLLFVAERRTTHRWKSCLLADTKSPRSTVSEHTGQRKRYSNPMLSSIHSKYRPRPRTVQCKRGSGCIVIVTPPVSMVAWHHSSSQCRQPDHVPLHAHSIRNDQQFISSGSNHQSPPFFIDTSGCTASTGQDLRRQHCQRFFKELGNEWSRVLCGFQVHFWWSVDESSAMRLERLRLDEGHSCAGPPQHRQHQHP